MDSPWLERRKAFWREVRRGSIVQTLKGLDEQSRSMVLELYCRKAERKREGKRKRGRAWACREKGRR